MTDRLNDIFKQRELFMEKIKNKFPETYPSWPVDIKTKQAQSTCRETALKGVEEMFEALGHLKNWKSHRETEITDFNRDEFVEEVVDAFNYFFSLMILIGVDADDFYSAFQTKDEIINKRITNGY